MFLVKLVTGLSAVQYILQFFERWVLNPISEWRKARKLKKIDEHYNLKQERIEQVKNELHLVKSATISDELKDDKMKSLIKKLNNMGQS